MHAYGTLFRNDFQKVFIAVAWGPNLGYDSSMEFLHQGADFFIHLDRHISSVSAHWGSWTYVIMFAIIFCETGLVVTPFLPGDSLLFVLGAMAAKGDLQLSMILLSLSVAAVGGNMLNYSIGVLLSSRVINNHALPFVKQAYIQRTHDFFEKYGAKTVIISRFVPIIRSFAPFLAGVGGMSYRRFTVYNILGGTGWVFVGVFSGFFFGNLPFVRKNFSLVILAIVIISLIPAAVEYFKHKNK
jgi:membrane-associated protein